MIFGFVAIAFVAAVTFIAVLFSRLFGRSAAASNPPRPDARPAPHTTRFGGDDVIDVVTTPVAKD
ncbi:MAG TPA: hypothetical protein VFJ90_16905 [Candidatus Didemnitutus sp.]|nr:hypothetical protein [Candidatus Didemnitutus sp.]